MQKFLREQVKLAKVYNSDWSYKDFAEVIDITAHSFYNWLNGYYELSEEKAKQLHCIVVDLLE